MVAKTNQEMGDEDLETGISLSPIKDKMYELGKKMKIKIIKKKKGGHKVIDTSPTARRVGRPEEAGHSSINPYCPRALSNFQ